MPSNEPSLNGTWKFYLLEETEEPGDNPSQYPIAAPVPGEVYPNCSQAR